MFSSIPGRCPVGASAAPAIVMARDTSRCLQHPLGAKITPAENQYLQKMGFPGGPLVKNLPANAGDTSSIPGPGRSVGEGNGNPLQYCCLARGLVGYSPWGRKESDTTKGLNNSRASQSVITGLGRVDDSNPLQPLGPPGGTWVDQALRGECSLLATLPCVARSGDSSMGHGVGKTLPLSARRRHITEDVVTAPTAGTGHRRDWPITSAPLPHTYILIFNP